MFANVCHFHPSLVFEAKTGGSQSAASYGTQLEWLAPSLATKYWTMEEIFNISQHSSLLQMAKIIAVKSFIVQTPVRYSLACKYWTRMEVTNRDKHFLQ